MSRCLSDYRPVITVCDVLDEGACLDGVLEYVNEHEGKIASQVDLSQGWMVRAALSDGYGCCYGHENGEGVGDGYGDGGGGGDGDGEADPPPPPPPRARRAAALHRWRGRRHPHAARLLAVVAAKLDGRPHLVESLRRRAGTDVKPATPEAASAEAAAAAAGRDFENPRDETPLSVAEDVARLTAMATDPDNLAAMYEGWMPWL